MAIKIDSPAFDYDKFGHDYSGHRQTDPRIAAYVYQELETVQTILNVGAGAGSYEPTDKYVVAVEPSEVMRAQRIAKGKRPALIGKAGKLPFDSNSFDACMAMVTIHHWPNIGAGLKELKRVSSQKVIVLTFDPDALSDFWNAKYFPELVEVEQQRFPSIDFIIQNLGGNAVVQSIPIPFDCVDGFQEAFYGRPEAFLNKSVRAAQSAWGFLPKGVEEIMVKRLAEDLESGEWDKKYGKHRKMPNFTCALKLIVASY